MFDEAAQVLEEIEPEEKTRNENLGARVNLDGGQEMGHGRGGSQPSGKIDPQTAGWWISLACG
jgi:hypothetical protein